MSFANSSNFTIHGSTFTDVGGNINNYTDRPGERGIRELFKGSCPNAAYDSQTYHSGGNPDVQRVIVQEVADWVKGGSTKICWIYGAPGAGKSTIMRDVATQCAHHGNLGASFFFNRNSLNYSRNFVTSIACQLVVAVPEKRLQLGEMIEADTSILQKPLAVQMQRLIVEPFMPQPNEDDEMPQPRPTSPPVVIVIDAIDECFGYSRQREIIDVIQDASSHSQLPILWVVASRPESTIRQSFDAIATQVYSISLADVGRLLETQLRVTLSTYLLNRFYKLHEKYPTSMMCFQGVIMFLLGVFFWIYLFPLLFQVISFIFNIIRTLFRMMLKAVSQGHQ
ncbi:hypothetical protein BDZ94DRAFT_1299114 [Collybia nuda]|uniref:Nephrocystin 3-like N-terminal domain-containing protein n=1 Tax=Collybia nuda TaxID=64659 RepID=A0A9P5Y3J4_9AGAR|nr:hypothetical protein BDZ94DRAFT_1299114 [Collybia nuda]